ncbi:MAG: hypothetical protein K2W96_23225 [Gemmataceae bacterium]|nr:hypothetical protein [Gemmataceae bacterium]
MSVPVFAALALLVAEAAAPQKPPPAKVTGEGIGRVFSIIFSGSEAPPDEPLPRIPRGLSDWALVPLPPGKPPAVYVGDELTRVPEASLEAALSGDAPRRATDRRMALAQAAALHLGQRERDGYLKAVLKNRADLAGLPFLLGEQGRTPWLTHLAFRSAAPSIAPGKLPARFDESIPAWHATSRRFTIYKMKEELFIQGATACVAQVIGPAKAEARIQAARFLGGMDAPATTRELARMAVYSPDAEVRAAALAPLAKRAAKDYEGVIEAGLSYPWPAVAKYAAEAAAALGRKDLLPALAGMLDAPDPRSPSEEGEVRELVRINHHRNCLLCHPATASPTNWDNALVGERPTPSRRLPERSLSTGGYGESDYKDSNLLVRIDTTYLRQDFSLMQPVKDAAPWPEMQRFDFVVRTRKLTETEAIGLRQRLEEAGPSPYRAAARKALRKLTGRDFGTDAEAWRRFLERS